MTTASARKVVATALLGALCLAPVPGCSTAANPAISTANFDKYEKMLVDDEDVRLKDMESTLGPGTDVAPATSTLPLPAEAKTETTWKWKVWEDKGNGNRIIAGFGPEGRLMKINGVFRQ